MKLFLICLFFAILFGSCNREIQDGSKFPMMTRCTVGYLKYSRPFYNNAPVVVSGVIGFFEDRCYLYAYYEDFAEMRIENAIEVISYDEKSVKTLLQKSKIHHGEKVVVDGWVKGEYIANYGRAKMEITISARAIR